MQLLHHIVPAIQQYGPVYGTWMYSFEGFNSWMCRRAHNRAYPEATVIETYRVRLSLSDGCVVVELYVRGGPRKCNCSKPR